MLKFRYRTKKGEVCSYATKVNKYILIMKIAIVDDNVLFAETLSKKIKIILDDKCDIKIINKVIDDLVVFEDIDVVYMDIELQEKSGIDFTKMIQMYKKDILTVFMSSFPIYSQYIFECNPLFFLIKPIDQNRLEASLHKVREKVIPVDTITLRANGEDFLVIVSDIIYIESNKRKLTVHTINNNYTIYGKLDMYYTLLPSYFCRCHQSFIVNLKYVKRKSNNMLNLYNGLSVPISQSKLSTVKREYLSFIIQ